MLEPAVFKQCERRAMEYIYVVCSDFCRPGVAYPGSLRCCDSTLSDAELLNLMGAFRWTVLGRTFSIFKALFSCLRRRHHMEETPSL